MEQLPAIPPSSRLKVLEAENCSIKKIHESFLRAGIEINLRNNQIFELPRDETLQFLRAGRQARDLRSRFDQNPLVYPPLHVFEEGSESVLKYLNNNLNSMVDPNDITILLIGNQEVGKSSFGLTLAGRITNASDVRPEDRTQAFDVYRTILDGITFTMIDIGGQREYESCMILLARENGLHLLFLNPSNFESPERMYSAVWSWVEKILDGSIAPHFMIVISKIDTIEKSIRDDKVSELTKNLTDLLDKEISHFQLIREKKLARLRSEQKDGAEALEQAQNQTVPDQEYIDVLQLKQQALDRKISSQIYKINHPINLNIDCIT